MIATAITAPELGAIHVDEVYPLSIFQRLSGLNRWAVRAAAKRGLKVLQVGRRKYVRGCDWHDYLGRLSEEQEQAGVTDGAAAGK